MKTNQAGQTNLFKGGKESLENTSEFKRKIEQIRKDVSDQYSPAVLNEKNWIRRILMVIRREMEIRRRIAELSSLKNLHAAKW